MIIDVIYRKNKADKPDQIKIWIQEQIKKQRSS